MLIFLIDPPVVSAMGSTSNRSPRATYGVWGEGLLLPFNQPRSWKSNSTGVWVHGETVGWEPVGGAREVGRCGARRVAGPKGRLGWVIGAPVGARAAGRRVPPGVHGTCHRLTVEGPPAAARKGGMSPKGRGGKTGIPGVGGVPRHLLRQDRVREEAQIGVLLVLPRGTTARQSRRRDSSSCVQGLSWILMAFSRAPRTVAPSPSSRARAATPESIRWARACWPRGARTPSPRRWA